MSRLLDTPIHPVLFGIFPIISLLNENAESISLRSSLRSLLIVGILIVMGTIMNYRFTKNPHRWGLVLSIFLIMFFSVKHLEYLTRGLLNSQGIPMYVALLFVIIPLLAALPVSKYLGTPLLTRTFNIMGGLVLILPSIQFIRHEIDFGRIPNDFEPQYERFTFHQERELTQDLPDIYYLILDGYARADILQKHYGFDNSDFLNKLEERGFSTPEHSLSNYAQTYLTIASVLNLGYLQDLIPESEGAAQRNPILNGLIQDSLGVKILESYGYTTIAFETGYRRSELRNSSHFLASPAVGANAFESFLIDMSLLRTIYMLPSPYGFQERLPGYERHRSRIDFTLQTLPRLQTLFDSPQFVFAHIICPHPPFVFTQEGVPMNPGYPYVINDADEFPGSSHEYEAGFRAQTAYMNDRVIEIVDELIDHHDGNVIIILQSDHGPGSNLIWDDPRSSDLQERMSILNSMYFPNRLESELPATLSQVNTLRIVFNRILGADLDLLDDRSYFSTWSAPLEFTEVNLDLR